MQVLREFCKQLKPDLETHFFSSAKTQKDRFFIIFTNSGFYVLIQLLLFQRYCG